jgi:hypothetical protein
VDQEAIAQWPPFTPETLFTQTPTPQITAEFFHRKSNPGKIVGISDSAANPENFVMCGNPATATGVEPVDRGAGETATACATRCAELAAQRHCEKCCSARILRPNGGPAQQAAFVRTFATRPQRDGNWWDPAGPYVRTGTQDVTPAVRMFCRDYWGRNHSL